MAEFRTTFVPKNPEPQPGSSAMPSGVPVRPSYAATHRGTFGLITVVLVVLLVATLLMGLGVYALDRSVTSQIGQLSDSLARSQKAFEPKVILELKDLDMRLKTASTLLQKHIAVSSFFEMLGAQTLPGIAYDSFRFINDEKEGYSIVITGRATSYETIAEQSSIFGDDSRVAQHVFSNFKLLDTGRISFDLFVVPSPSGILYVESQLPAVQPQATTTSNQNSVSATTTETSGNPLFSGNASGAQSVIIQNVQ